jgi:hypothetical protein
MGRGDGAVLDLVVFLGFFQFFFLKELVDGASVDLVGHHRL